MIEPPEEAARVQMRRVLRLRTWPDVEVVTRAVFDHPVRKLRWLRALVTRHRGNVDRLLLGQYRLSLARHLAHQLQPQETVVVDDGMGALLTEARRRGTGSGLDALVGRPEGMLRRRVHPLVGLQTAELARVTFFSIYDVGQAAPDRLERNTYRHVRRRLPSPTPNGDTVLLGSSVVETGIVTEGAWYSAVRSAVWDVPGRLPYLAHRREDPDKLRRLARDLPVDVEMPDLPVELLFFFRPQPRLVLSAVSTAIDTLRLLHPEAIEVRLLRLPTRAIAPIARSDFLSQQDRFAAQGIQAVAGPATGTAAASRGRPLTASVPGWAHAGAHSA